MASMDYILNPNNNTHFCRGTVNLILKPNVTLNLGT